MQCCICENTSENVSKCSRITFQGFPSEVRLRAAWLKALGQQDSHLPDPAAVCSQHFMHDDFCETENGSRQLRTGAIPSITVHVCMICLDTDSKMFPVSQYNLEEAYQKLTGHPVRCYECKVQSKIIRLEVNLTCLALHCQMLLINLLTVQLFQLCDGGNLKQTLCVQCAQGLRNFSRFRDKSLRARSLLMELLEKHELITVQHIKMIRHANNQLRSSLVSTILGPDHCDMYIKENSDERQTNLEENEDRIKIKTECSDESQLVDEDMQMINEENADCGKVEITLDPLKYESTQYNIGRQEFPHKHEYGAHAGMQLHGGAHPAAPSAHAVVTSLFAKRTTNNGYKARMTERAGPKENSERALISNSASDNRATDRTNTDVNFSDIMKYPQNPDIKVESSTQSLQTVCFFDSLNAHTACKDAKYRAKTEDKVATAHNKPAASTLSETEPGTSGNSSRTRTFTCDVCQHAFTRKHSLVVHMSTHTGYKPYSCEICNYKCASNGNFRHHMKTHTGEKPYSCKICRYQFAQKRTLEEHMMTHMGEKPYSCKLCDYQCARKRYLVDHMMTHTGEKPYSCEKCSFKSAQKKYLVEHMKLHTGEKPFSCTICEYKCIQKRSLVNHMSTHTGEKPYSCQICSYKTTQKKNLVTHMRTHTGEKPYSCELCSYKSTQKRNLVTHMRNHTGEKPYSCEMCSFKTSQKSSLYYHMRSHTGEKPYSCEICSYKCTQKRNLVTHMRTHTGEKPFSCTKCEYRCKQKGSLLNHMRTHTGEKPYSCEICSYKSTFKKNIVTHMRTHTGEKPFSCEICSYKSTQKRNLARHIMKTHTG